MAIKIFSHSSLDWYQSWGSTWIGAAAKKALCSGLFWVIVSRFCTGRPIYSFTFISHFFFWPPWCRSPAKVPGRIVFDKVFCQVTWPKGPAYGASQLRVGFLMEQPLQPHKTNCFLLHPVPDDMTVEITLLATSISAVWPLKKHWICVLPGHWSKSIQSGVYNWNWGG